MRSYQPSFHGDAAIRREFEAVRKAALRPDALVHLEVLHEVPEKLSAGMLVLADGSDWNPGSGEGLYRRNAANSAWVFIG